MTSTSESEKEFHRKTARQCFNEAWNLFDKKSRDDSEGRLMLHLAHASRYHWGIVGTASNIAVSDWQISRIYVSLNQPALALQFARSCLELCEINGLSEVLHTAYEGMARAYAISMDSQSAKDYLTKAREHLAKLQLDVEDGKIYLDQISETEQMIERSLDGFNCNFPASYATSVEKRVLTSSGGGVSRKRE